FPEPCGAMDGGARASHGRAAGACSGKAYHPDARGYCFPSRSARPEARTTGCPTLSWNTFLSPVIRLNQFLARVMPVYTSSLVSTGLRRSGSTRQVWLNSEPWDLCTVIAYTVSSCCRRLGEIQRMPPVLSPLGNATRRVSLGSPLAVLSQGTLKVIPISPFIRPRL